ncbi:MAG: LysR substrate-binding domain-containing protein [Pseudomonadota bacterium]
MPPMNALRAFEAAARHGGYIGAAAELHVTRGAISRHVKLLEADLGVQLFDRGANGVTLTPAGREFLPVLTDAFERIGYAARALSGSGDELRLICPPSLSIRWLIPRLDRFRAAHPDIRVALTTDFYSDRGFDAAQFDIGLSVEYPPGRAQDIAVAPLFPIHLSPACSPEFAKSIPHVKTPADLASIRLLHERPSHFDWEVWVNAFEVAGLDLSQGEAFLNFDLAARAATLGAGVVMADLALCHDELALGTLVLLFPDLVCAPLEGRYALIGPKARWNSPNVAAFRAWAAAEAAELNAALA